MQMDSLGNECGQSQGNECGQIYRGMGADILRGMSVDRFTWGIFTVARVDWA